MYKVSNAIKAGVRNLQPAGQMQPVWTFDMTHIKILVTQFRVQNHVKTKLYDKMISR